MGLEEGWISIDDVANVWQEAIRKLEQEVYPPGNSPHRDSIIGFFESVKYELWKRSYPEKKKRVQHYNNTRKNPEPGNTEQNQDGTSVSPNASDIDREKRDARTKSNRMHAVEGLG